MVRAQLYVFVTVCFGLVFGYIIVVCEIFGYFVWSLSLFLVYASQITVVSLPLYIYLYMYTPGHLATHRGVWWFAALPL